MRTPASTNFSLRAAQADASDCAVRGPAMGTACPRHDRRRPAAGRHSARTSVTSPTGHRRRLRPISPRSCPARSTSPTPTAVTRSTRTNRNSSPTRSARLSTRCAPARPSWRRNSYDSAEVRRGSKSTVLKQRRTNPGRHRRRGASRTAALPACSPCTASKASSSKRGPRPR